MPSRRRQRAVCERHRPSPSRSRGDGIAGGRCEALRAPRRAGPLWARFAPPRAKASLVSRRCFLDRMWTGQAGVAIVYTHAIQRRACDPSTGPCLAYARPETDPHLHMVERPDRRDGVFHEAPRRIRRYRPVRQHLLSRSRRQDRCRAWISTPLGDLSRLFRGLDRPAGLVRLVAPHDGYRATPTRPMSPRSGRSNIGRT